MQAGRFQVRATWPRMQSPRVVCLLICFLFLLPCCLLDSIFRANMVLVFVEEERLGLVQGDSAGHHRALPPYQEESDIERSPSDDYAYDDDMKSYSSDKAGRYGRGITDSRARAASGSSSEGDSGTEKGLGIRGEAPPKPPAHGPGYGGSRGGGSGGAGGTGTPAAYL